MGTRVCVLGVGVIGTTYAYVLQKAGYEVFHLVRDHKVLTLPSELPVHLLDGRDNPKGEERDDVYHISLAETNATYDFIFVSVASGALEQAVHTIKQKRVKGTLVFFCNIWNDRKEIERMAGDYPYILAFPTAGGCMENHGLNCVLFDHVMLERMENSHIPNYAELVSMLGRAGVKTESPYDMLEWIWIHMAVNAGVTSTAARKGDVGNPKRLAIELMGDSRALAQAVRCIRETLKVVEARGVVMKNYRNEILPYKTPAFIAGIMMKRLFAKDKLASRIMTLHNDVQDMLYGCRCVYEEGKRRNLSLPIFYENIENVLSLNKGKNG